MKCPLKFRLTDYGAEIERIYTGDCLNVGCAWWDSKKGQCCILTLAQSSYSLKETIQNHLIKR